MYVLSHQFQNIPNLILEHNKGIVKRPTHLNQIIAMRAMMNL